jgi:hypothetical protein
MTRITKMRKIKYLTKQNQIEAIKSELGKYNLENHVILNGYKLICHRTFLSEISKKFGDIWHFW